MCVVCLFFFLHHCASCIAFEFYFLFISQNLHSSAFSLLLLSSPCLSSVFWKKKGDQPGQAQPGQTLAPNHPHAHRQARTHQRTSRRHPPRSPRLLPVPASPFPEQTARPAAPSSPGASRSGPSSCPASAPSSCPAAGRGRRRRGPAPLLPSSAPHLPPPRHCSGQQPPHPPVSPRARYAPSSLCSVTHRRCSTKLPQEAGLPWGTRSCSCFVDGAEVSRCVDAKLVVLVTITERLRRRRVRCHLPRTSAPIIVCGGRLRARPRDIASEPVPDVYSRRHDPRRP